MSSAQQAAFNAGVKVVPQVALTAAVMVEARDNARDVRPRAALQG